MAIKYARSTDGVNSDDGSTWALANLDLGGASGAATDAAAGDTIYVSQVHAESSGAPIITLAGTPALPVKVICANDAAEPPTATATTATVTATSNLTVNGSGYFYGITWKAGSGGSVTQSFLSGTSGASNNQVYDNCSFQILTTGTGLAKISFGDEGRTDSNRYWIKNTTFKFAGANQRIKVAGHFRLEGGSFLAGGTAPVNVFETGLRGVGDFLVSNFDLSANIGSSFNLLIQPSGGSSVFAKFRNLSLPTSWSGALWSATPASPGIRAEMANSFIGATKMRFWAHDYAGIVKDETTIVRTGGSTDDTVLFSMKMVSTADAEYPAIPFEGAPINVYADSTGSPVTYYVEVVHDSQGSGTASALTNADMIIKAFGPGPFTSNVKADVLTAAADHASSSATWTTTGLTTPVKQKLAITFTPTSKGVWTLIPVLFKASATVYVCQKVT